ncbi:uncharacterized protein TNIN_111951 [Trichonephila inaurata madagascariensis]|uniref:Uncharacterized protein n=1 Tax=Trichonephila inaurata madagascariensis TaxID=2747483 RepID=A0A8X6X272_9ARAC|nr:uncharacterized protein TNIN_111951 [Trichonephila inaurata madagascariensis]
MTLSLIALPTVLWNRFKRLRSLTFVEILRKIEKSANDLTLRASVEKKNVELLRAIIWESARVVGNQSIDAVIGFGFFLKAIWIFCRLLRVLVLTLPGFLKSKLKLAFVSFLSNDIEAFSPTFQNIIDRFK